MHSRMSGNDIPLSLLLINITLLCLRMLSSCKVPSDYQGGEKLAIFEIGSSTATVVFNTVNDGIQEGLESFFADLTVPPAMMAMGDLH